MGWATLDKSLTRGARPPVRNEVGFDPCSEVAASFDGHSHWCPVCKADSGHPCKDTNGHLLVSRSLDCDYVHAARAKIGIALAEPQDPKETPLPFRHAQAQEYDCPICLQQTRCPCRSTAVPSPFPAGGGVHLARISLSEIVASNTAGDPLCCYDVGGGWVCSEPGKMIGVGYALCTKHWRAGRVKLANAGQMICEAEGCNGVATKHAGRRAQKASSRGDHVPAVSKYWCDSHVPSKGHGMTILKVGGTT